MATDFFQRQSEAQRNTWWLVILFVLAVIGIVGTVMAAVYAAVLTQMEEPQTVAEFPQQILSPAIAGAVTLLVILGGSLFKIAELRTGGGTRVAESLGGKRIYPNSKDSHERRLLNVVEEMALASGTPVPPVFLLDEDGINAFAAGYSPRDAVLGVTRGCMVQLTRDELQGVIAHEFSHVLNGDMRMSIRLIGILNGILLLGLLGQFLFRMFIYSGAGRSRRSSSGDNKGGGQVILLIMAAALVLVVVGFIGTFFGNLIKAAVSRQREYLADASAVQFTRNPAGIADALKRIGAASSGSRLKAANAAEASHMYFAQGVWEGISGLWATHPPLNKRIRAIEPNWDGSLPAPLPPTQSGAEAGSRTGTAGFQAQQGAVGLAAAAAASNPTEAAFYEAAEVPVGAIDQGVEQIGEPTTAHRHYAAELIAELPPDLVTVCHDPYGARAIVFALLMDSDEEIRGQQRAVLTEHAPADVRRLVGQYQGAVDELDARVRLPVVDICLPALCSLSPSQYNEFRALVNALARADSKIELFEWTLWQVIMRHLHPHFANVTSPRTQYYSLRGLRAECATLLSLVAAAGNEEQTARLSFVRGVKELPELHLEQQPGATLVDLGEVLDKLATASAKQRGRVVHACAEAICADEHVTWQEAELLRGIADLLDCPMPPLLVPQSSSMSN